MSGFDWLIMRNYCSYLLHENQIPTMKFRRPNSTHVLFYVIEKVEVNRGHKLLGNDGF